MITPLYTHLLEYHSKNRISFAMPGHKNGVGLPPHLAECDVTELELTEDLHLPGEFIKRSQSLIAKKYHAYKSYILTGGSTAGVQTMIAAALNPGDILLSTPDCHMSVINSCALLGIRIMLMPISPSSDGHYRKIDTKSVISILKENKQIKAIAAVSPDYYGVSKNISELIELCHSFGIPLLVDQAHGAHFVASNKFPQTASELGADCTVMSAHKTLNAMTGAAYLHFNSKIINKSRLTRALSMFQTSSPSYPIAASAETAALTMNQTEWELCISQCNALKTRLNSTTNISILENDDPTRLVFSVPGLSGIEAQRILSESHGIDIEMSDSSSIVLIATPSNNESDFDALYSALLSINTVGNLHKSITPRPPEGVFSPSRGFFSEHEYVDLNTSIEKIAACTVTAYPPGIPIICSGASVTENMIKDIHRLQKAGIKITGLENNKLAVTKS